MQHLPTSIATELNQPYTLSQTQLDFYEKNRFIKLKGVFSEETVHYFRMLIDAQVERMNTENRPLEERSTYGKAFLQLFNLWRQDERIAQLILSPRLGKIATELMACDGARLYHDQALYKEPGGGFTPWHADQFYWPLETDKTITAWIPLQETPLEMGPLEFSAGSHLVVEGRELAISDESEQQIQHRLRVTDFSHVVEPYALGEISFHSGWVFHRAGANQSKRMRAVMTAIYMDKDMHLKAPENNNQQLDWDTWCPGASIGSVIDTPLNPVVYPIP